ncbi:hypothetical protein FACS1894198_5140 [Clostridia bacterium]|nr:hypothetical protein FACS1894198_5140 [Clostridia bacterium]
MIKKNNYAHVDRYIAEKRTRIARQRKRKRKRVAFRAISLFLLLITILVCAYFSLGIFFKVKNISVSGKSRYSDEQIFKASRLERDENIFGVNLKKVRENIERSLLYAENVDVKRKLPISISIVMNDAKPMCALKSGEGYIVLSKGLKILEQNVLTIDKNLDIIKGVKLVTPILGEKIEDEVVLDKLSDFTVLSDYIKRAGLKNIGTYDLEDLQNIKLYSRDEEHKIKVKFGGMDQADYKVRSLAAVLARSMNEETKGELDLTDLVSSKRAIWKPEVNRVEVNNKEEVNDKKSDKKTEEQSKKLQ